MEKSTVVGYLTQPLPPWNQDAYILKAMNLLLWKIQQRKAQTLRDIFDFNIYYAYELNKKNIKDLFRPAKKESYWGLDGGGAKQAVYPTVGG